MTRYNLLAAVASVAMLCSNSIFAQDTIALSIDNLFDLADQNSTKLRCLETDINVAQAAVDAAKAERLPDVSTSLSLSYLGNGNLWDRDFKNGSSIPMPHFGNNFALRASQAIYTGGGITSAINLAELEKKLAVLNRNESRSNVRFLLIGYYLQLLRLNNQEKVFCHNISLTEQVIDQMHARHNAGTALDNDITRYELQLENLKLQRTRITDTRKIINHRLITIVGLPASTTIVPDSAIAHTIPATLTESDWQHAAATNAVALQKALLNVDICRTKESLQQAELMPKISVIAEEHLDGPITIEVPTINKNFNYWYVGIGINYNISALFKSKKKLQQVMSFKHFFQSLCVFNMLHMTNGGVVGAAIYATGMRYYMSDNIARYAQHIDSVRFTMSPFDFGEWMEKFIESMLMVSVKQIYGWVLYVCIFVTLMFLLYDRPFVRHTLRRIPSWRTVGRRIAAMAIHYVR